MAEYIEREALLDKLFEEGEWTQAISNTAYAMPAVDVVPVAQSTWEVVHGVFTPGGDPLLRCPICKARESEHLCGVECRTVWHYCPVCGAHLKEGRR